MEEKNDKKHPLRGPRTPKPSQPAGGGQFIRNFLTGIFVLLMVVFLYSVIAQDRTGSDQISLSQLASDISAGKVTQVVVNGDDLEVHYDANNEVIKKAKKEE